MITDVEWQQIFDPSVRFLPRRPGPGTHVEVYLPTQVLAVFRDDEPIFISHISSGELRPDGKPATFCETATYDTDEYGNPYPEPVTKQVCAESKSPGGVFRFNRSYDGQRISPLGGMKNPWYFNYGIAIHGARNVPTRPASHGCIRISNSLADVFPDLVGRGDRVYVWGHDGKEPEQYSERESLPSFNRPDPDATTTTTRRHDHHHRTAHHHHHRTAGDHPAGHDHHLVDHDQHLADHGARRTLTGRLIVHRRRRQR